MKNNPSLNQISDEELQARIERFGKQMLEANERFRTTKAIEDRAERDRCWIAQKGLLHERARRRRLVERMEQGRGLA